MMLQQIVPHFAQEVKCEVEGCDEPQFRKSGLCYDHFVKEELAAWNDQAAARRMALEGVGYIFGDPVGEVMA
jgi:hypothetical protein